MGTVASVHVADAAEHTVIEPAVDALFDELDRLEAMFSTFRPDSEISRFNRGELHLGDCPAEVNDVLDACTWLSHASSGAFTIEPPDRPGQIDPAGMVKGWAAQRAARQLTAEGLLHWYVAIGGDVQTAGRRESGEPWRVGIVDPRRPDRIAARFELPEGHAAATSGRAARGDHIWLRDAADHRSFGSITVIGPDLTWADAFATTAYAMGPAGPAWVRDHAGYQVIVVTADGEVATADGPADPDDSWG